MNKECFSIHFKVSSHGILFTAVNEGAEVMNCSFDNGEVKFRIVYDFRKDVPLCLSGKAVEGDSAVINILPYRIELYIGEILTDEEWPCGSHFLETAQITENDCEFSVCEIRQQKGEEPSVTYSFQEAEGWKPGENVFVGDCMPYSHDGKYHVLYLKDRHHHQSKWGLGAHQWEHISTKDMKIWDVHPMAVEIDDPAEASICTGSWILKDDTHYLFYTVRTCDGSPARIRRSVSVDGYHFKKDRGFSFSLSDTYNAASARDPKVVKDACGKYHMFLTTSFMDTGNGCLAHLISDDLEKWEEMKEPLYIAPQDMGEPECPDYFYKNGFYYLVYSLYGKGYYQYSRKPFTEWCMPENSVIPCKSVPKAAVIHDRLIFTGYSGDGENYAGTMTFLEAFVKENGELTYHLRSV